jgi:hypothetical protein
MLRGNPNFLILLDDALERSFCGAQGLFKLKRWKTTALLLAWMRPPLSPS